MLRTLILIGALSVAADAAAESLPDSDSDSDIDADALAEAKGAVRMGEYLRAQSLLAKLWRRQQAWDVAAAIGGVQSKLKEYPDAAFYLSYALATLPVSSRGTPTEKRIRHLLKTARSHVTQVDLFLEPLDAKVMVDGVVREAPIFLWPGAHELTVSQSGYEDFSREIVGSGGDVRRLNIELVGIEQVNTVSQPPTTPKPPVDMTTNQREPAVLWVGGSIAVGLGVAAVIFQIQASENETARSSFQRENFVGGDNSACFGVTTESCKRLEALSDSAENNQNIAIALGIGAGVAAAATAVTYLLWSEEVPVRAAFSPTGAYLGYHVAF